MDKKREEELDLAIDELIDQSDSERKIEDISKTDTEELAELDEIISEISSVPEEEKRIKDNSLDDSSLDMILDSLVSENQNTRHVISDETAVSLGKTIIENAKAGMGEGTETSKVKRYRLKKGMGLKLGAVLSVFLVAMIFIVGNSYAWFSQGTKGKKDNDVEAAIFEVAYEGDTEAIELENAYPVTDAEGLKTTAYQFRVINKGNVNAIYGISLSEHSITTLDKSLLRYTIKKNGETESEPASLSNLNLMQEQLLLPGQTDTYELKLWLSEEATNEAMGKKWVSKVQVISKEQ